MKHRTYIIISFIIFLLGSCIVEYIPTTDEESELLNVEGMITDQAEINTIVLSKSIPLWTKQIARRLSGCKVWISDDLGRITSLKETIVGTYVTNPATFRGETGRTYILHIKLNEDNGNLSYESLPVKMTAGPQIDSIYYEKKTFDISHLPVEGCQIYLDTHDPANNCNFYRWKYSETWEFHLPFDVKNKICWISNNIDGIFIKNTSILEENRISRYPVITIQNPVDKLSVKYSILVKQYSMNEEEYIYWERLKTTLDQTGGLYDLIPAYIPNNIFCIEKPEEKILGYFSVSAVSSKRIFIKDNFTGMDAQYQYQDCIFKSDTAWGRVPPQGLDDTAWVTVDHSDRNPPYFLYTHVRRCGDCRTRGTLVKPDFWDDDVK